MKAEQHMEGSFMGLLVPQTGKAVQDSSEDLSNAFVPVLRRSHCMSCTNLTRTNRGTGCVASTITSTRQLCQVLLVQNQLIQ